MVPGSARIPTPEYFAPLAGRRRPGAQCYNRVSFPFQHNLHEHELFELHNLLDLAERQGQSPTFAHWSNGRVNVGDRWESGSGLRYSLRQTIRDIADNNSLAMLKHVEQDRIFGPVVM